jgi:hypothetical protein
MTPEQLAANTDIRQEFERQLCENVTQLNCDDARTSPYRTVDGTCNNLDHPEWGAAVTPQPRYQPAEYDDGKMDNGLFPVLRRFDNIHAILGQYNSLTYT